MTHYINGTGGVYQIRNNWYGHSYEYVAHSFFEHRDVLDLDEETKPSKTSTPLYGKDPNKVFGKKKKKGKF